MPIKFTKNQTLILEIFFNNTERSYFLRELGRIIGKQPGIFQKDINTLEKKGILISEYQSNSRFFRLNKNYILYDELESIFFKTSGAEGKLKEMFANIKNAEIIFIFGSFAKKEEDSFSDIDLMIIGNPDEDSFIGKISDLEDKLKREINYHIFSKEDWSKHKKEKESFIVNILQKPKIFITGNEDELQRIN